MLPACARAGQWPRRCAITPDPGRAVSELTAGLDLPDDPGHRDRIEDFLAAQRAGKRDAPPTELETLGYDHQVVLAEPSIARYCERYGIDPEVVRLTGRPQLGPSTSSMQPGLSR